MTKDSPMTPLDFTELLKAAAEKAEKLAPGQWERDTEKGEGEYGVGPDTHEGYLVPYVYDGRGKRLFDAHQTDIGEVHEEWDGDEDGSYCTATDEASCAVLDYCVLANPTNVKALIAALEERGDRIDSYALAEAETDIAFKDLDAQIADQAATIAAQAARTEEAMDCLSALVAVVRGECPSLLNEDSGGDAELSLRIDALLTTQGEG